MLVTGHTMGIRGRGSSNKASRAIPGLGSYGDSSNNATNVTVIICQENAETAATILFLVAGIGIAANMMVMFFILARKGLRR